MKRKAIQLANSTIVISLPSKWIKEHNIKKGDEIDVTDSGNKLIITNLETKEVKKIRLDINNLEINTFKRIFASIINVGYNEIELISSSQEKNKTIQKFLRNSFTNLIAIKQSENSLIIKTIYEDNHKEFENILKRFFQLGTYLAEDTSEAIKKDNIEELFEASLIRFEMYKSSNYLKRAINSGYEIENKKSHVLYSLIEGLMNITDAHLRIGRYVIDNKIKIKKEISSFFQELVSLHGSFQNLFYDFNLGEIKKHDLNYKEIDKKLEKLYLITSHKEIKIIGYYDIVLNQFKELTKTLIALHI